MSLRSTLAALAAALTLALPVAASAQMKIGYVDSQRVLAEVDDGKAAKKRLQGWLDDKEKELEEEQEALRKEKEMLDKQASAMSEETRHPEAGRTSRRRLSTSPRGGSSTGSRWPSRQRRSCSPSSSKIDQVIARSPSAKGSTLVFEKARLGHRLRAAAVLISPTR